METELFGPLVLMIINRICQGIDYLHSNQLIHRDIKPTNILIDHDSLSYISDFETIRNPCDEEMTMNFCSLYYIAPEIHNGVPYSYPVDIYSFGLVIYFIFEKQHAKTGLTPLPMVNGTAYMRILYEKCIKMPDQRPTIQEVKNILEFDFGSLSHIKHFFIFESTLISKFPKLEYTNQDVFTQFIYENIIFYNDYYKRFDIYIDRLFDMKAEYTIFCDRDKVSYLLFFADFYMFFNPLKAIEYIEYAIEFDSAEAYYKLGFIYTNGIGVEKDYIKALHYFQIAADKKHSGANASLGYMYMTGQGVKLNYSKAKECLKLAGTNSLALANLGVIHRTGYDVPVDYDKARLNFELSAKEGNPNAYNFLGILYLKGLCVQQDYKMAKTNFELGANHLDLNAYINLGNLYFHGLGVKKDYKKAKKYYQLAINHGNSTGYLKLAKLCNNQNDKVICYKLAAKDGHPKAFFYLAEYFISNDMIESNLTKATAYYLKCIKVYKKEIILNNNFFGTSARSNQLNKFQFHAYNNLGLVYLIIYQDIEKGIQYIKESAYREYPFAQNNFGLLYLFYLNQLDNAKYMFQRSAENKFALAYYNLGYMNEKDGMTEDSIKYYIKASECEDEPLVYHQKIHVDEKLEISKTFIICFTNLKLVYYYLSQFDNNEAKKYFIKAYSKFQFKIQISMDDQKNAFSDLEDIILSFPSFELPKLQETNQNNFANNDKLDDRKKNFEDIKENEKRKIDYNQINDALNIISQMKIKSKFKGFNDNHILPNSNIRKERKITFEDPSELFCFVIQDKKLFNSFVNEIKRIIDIMHDLIYTEPLSILFGRIGTIKHKKENDISRINQLFYDGLGDI